MSQSVRILYIGDSGADAVAAELRRGGWQPTFERVLSVVHLGLVLSGNWDIAISDFAVGEFGALEALRLIQEKGVDLPLIVVSARAVAAEVLEALKAGAADHLTRRNLMRLNAAVEREIRAAKARRDRIRLEEQFRQAQKMEAVGRLAGGVAHDFNNLLTVITGYSDLLLASRDLLENQRTALEEIRRSAERGGALTGQLLAFSRRQPMQSRIVQINTVVLQIEKMLRRLIGEDIELVTLPAASQDAVQADPSRLEQVIMNLVVNSRDAMPNGGKLTIETMDVSFDERDATHHGVAPGQYVLLAVSDTGEGMDEKTQKLIFEPFFTTKEPGKGTGLGLSTVYGIVSQVKGHIWVYSEPGNGTTFKIYFPATVEAAAEDHVASGSKPTLCGTETVLVVEDSELLRNLITQFLRDSGYKVLIAPDGQQALQVADECAGAIDLLLTDVVMPVLGGQELAAKLSTKYPDLAVLFMSGYTDSALVHQGAIEGDRSFLQKPFSPDVLLARVREVLDRAQENKPTKRLAV